MPRAPSSRSKKNASPVISPSGSPSKSIGKSSKTRKSPPQSPSKSTSVVPKKSKAATTTAKHAFALELQKTIVGEIFVVGSGDCGQLGLGPDVVEKERPAKLHYFEDKKIVSVFAGGLHCIVLTLDGKLYSWGCNDQKALGRDGEETEPAPVQGLDHEFIVSVACGDSVSLALTREGRVYQWGTFRNANGIFGVSARVKIQDKPTLIPELKHIVSIDAGTNHAVAVSKEGKVYTWGVGEQGQLGRKIMDRHMKEASLGPRPVNFRPYGAHSNKFTKAFCGAYHTFLVHESNQVYSFGLNNHGQLGLGGEGGVTADQLDVPELIPELKEVDMMSGGEHHSLALDTHGTVFVFGRGDSGQLGLGDSTSTPIPTKLSTLSQPASKISAGGAFSLALTTDANMHGWGYGEMGQLANGSEDEDSPAKFELKERRVLDVSAGGQHTLMLLAPKDV